jgi:alkylated DNA repair dioxygenase AlkB
MDSKFTTVVFEDSDENLASFHREEMGKSSWLDVGYLPAHLSVSEDNFQEFWDLHPETRHEILMYGKPVKVPRYQQAYVRDYSFSGSVSKILPLPEQFKPYLDWSNSLGYPGKFNGLLINWYEGGENYIGSHADDEKQLVENSPIITITLSLPGEPRIFRLRNKEKKIVKDIETPNGIVLTMGGSFQKEFKHEIVKTAKLVGSRISITIRQFK